MFKSAYKLRNINRETIAMHCTGQNQKNLKINPLFLNGLSDSHEIQHSYIF